MMPRNRCRVLRTLLALALFGALGPVAFSMAGALGTRTRGSRAGRRLDRCVRHFWPFGQEQVSEKLKSRFESYAEGEGAEMRLKRENLRSVLECTESFCLSKHWLAESTLDRIYEQYATSDGIGLKEFGRLAHDGFLLEGKIEEYEKAFTGVDTEEKGVISKEALGRLFEGLGKSLSSEELTRLVDEADVDHDGIDFADFLGLARTQLDLAEVIRYLETTPERPSEHEGETDSALGHMNTVHSEAELYAMIGQEDAVVKLAFTWCRPCKAFLPRYEKFAKIYEKTRFLKIVGNENESCKHYAKEVLHAKISPMFAVYRQGKLVKTWHGANNGRFVSNLEGQLPTAREYAKEREAAQKKDDTLAAT
ncbi:unnamed protein product [Durusdinium trenchii]|uniref:EF-hand domain-containing protein n=1 Tax=Durusdinium trenchii TaxID=1381693 RepID=A0ABP0R1Y6_9DINO